MKIIPVKFGLFEKFGYVFSGQILGQLTTVLYGGPATYKNCVCTPFCGWYAPIYWKRSKKIPLGDFPLCYNSQEAKKKHNGVF